jgi:hypothetical protein
MVYNFYIPGALSADKDIYIEAPCDMTLKQISGQCITQDATLQVSDVGRAITDSITVTAGTTPIEADQDDFLNDEYPQIRKGSVIKIDVGHGSNCVDLNFALVFTPG